MTTLVDAPTRVDGVQLIGEMVGSGYRTPPALVRRGDGQVLQLTKLLYLVLHAADGRRSCAEIADLVGDGLGRTVTEADVRTLVDSKLRPLGLLTQSDGSVPQTRRSDPLLRIKPRVAVTNPGTTRRLTDPFRPLFRPTLVVGIVAGFLAVVGWVFFDRGLGASAYDAFQRPHLLLLVFVVAVLSGGFHEFGHAAATRYGGGTPGAMGAGLYLVWPAFYTDVTDSYRLDRVGRIRTDLGGLYFNAIVVVGTFVWWWATRWEALLLLVAVQVLQMVQQLLPLMRFDGYHVLADLAGVPDLYNRIHPTLLGLLPHRWNAAQNRVLKPSARALITLWVLVTIPMMVLMLLAVVRAVPRLLGTAGSVIGKDLDSVAQSWRAGNYLDVAAGAAQVLTVLLPVMACTLVLSRTAQRFFRGLLRWSKGSPPKRVVAAVLSAAIMVGLSWAWWPNPDTYKPIQPGERGRITQLLPASERVPGKGLARSASSSGAQLPGTAAQSRLSGGEPLMAAFQRDQALPTKNDPVLAMVLVPQDQPGDGGTFTSPPDGTWVFPFDKPLPPAEGGNQALAVATENGSVTYDVAFALVWADGDEVRNINEAHAYASCTDCVAVAIAFQVLLIMDDAQVVAPQNLAVAANYDCYHCITAAIASQLVLSLPDQPGHEQLLALGEVWNRLTALAGSITSYSLTQITTELDAFKAEIVAILKTAPPAQPEDSPSNTTSATPTATTSPSSTSTQDGATTSPSPSPEATTTAPSPDEPGTSSPSPTNEPTTSSTGDTPSAGDPTGSADTLSSSAGSAP